MKLRSPMTQRARVLAAGLAAGAAIVGISATMPRASAEEPKKGGFLEEVEQWQDKMSDKFRDTWRELSRDRAKTSAISASVDLREQDNSYMVRLNLPERDLSKVEVKLDGDTLHITAPAAGKSGRYEQSVMLAGVAPGAKLQIDRREKDDLIVVTVPKTSAAREVPPLPERPDIALSPRTEWESDVLKSMEEMRLGMDRIFEKAFDELRLAPEHRGYFDNPSFGSFVDLKEDGANYIVTAYLPDRDIKNVNVTVEGLILKIEAKEQTTTGQAKEGQTPMLSRKAYYSQLLTLPGEVQADKMKVDRKEGVLTVTLPKAESG